MEGLLEGFLAGLAKGLLRRTYGGLTGFASGFLFYAPPGENDEHQHGETRGSDQGMMRDNGDDFWPQLDDQQGEEQPANHPTDKNGKEEGRNLHLKDSGGKDECLPGSGRGQHGGDQHGQKLLAAESVAQLFKALAIDAIEQKELSAGTAQCIRQQAAHGRTRCG